MILGMIRFRVIGDRISEPWTLNHDKTGKNKN